MESLIFSQGKRNQISLKSERPSWDIDRIFSRTLSGHFVEIATELNQAHTASLYINCSLTETVSTSRSLLSAVNIVAGEPSPVWSTSSLFLQNDGIRYAP
ncbi:hypothetical protein ZWY2020_035836 [Hordeum vulgare]|nr:hypothetical protein ZWY2020_035836 [Hordeum vulgare]